MVSPRPGPSGRQRQTPGRKSQQRQQRQQDEFDPLKTYCEACDKYFSSVKCKNRHVRDHHQRLQIEQWTCFVCHAVFNNEADRLAHFDEVHQPSTQYYRSVSALSGAMTVQSRDFNHDLITEQEQERPFELLCSDQHTNELKDLMTQHLSTCASFKASLIVTCLFRKEETNDENMNLPSLFPLRTHQFHVYQQVNMNNIIHHMLEEVNDRLDDINVNETGWKVVRVSVLKMIVSKTQTKHNLFFLHFAGCIQPT